MPTVAHLLDHTARVWRLTESLDPVYRATERSYDLVHPALACFVGRDNTNLAEPGPGIVQAGQRMIHCDVGNTFQERDIIEVYSGPNAPVVLEVEAQHDPRGHHTQLRCILYQGKVPELGS